MKVTYYCQHVLGIGHFHRSLEICKELSKTFSTTLILGGPPVPFDSANLQLFQLPGLRMDSEFGNLSPCDPNLSLDKTKLLRQQKLFDFFSNVQPDFFITELYPFGRKAFRFELDPVLSGIKSKKLAPCRVLCSVRDILVEKTQGREKFEKRVVDTLNSYYDGVLIHSDPNIIQLDQTFDRYEQIKIPCHYTGFVSRKQNNNGSINFKEKLGLNCTTKLIVASIGGGSVGTNLLQRIIAACTLLEQSDFDYYLQLFTGPYCDQKEYENLKKQCLSKMNIARFSVNFPDWLASADLSISMGGYNSCMNLADTGVPALVYPFAQNQEQRLRAKKLATKLPIHVMEESDLAPRKLAELIREQIHKNRKISDIDLDGAVKSNEIINNLVRN